jgi:hypothetical protein
MKEMTETKYGKYVIREPIDDKYNPPFPPKGRPIPNFPPFLHFFGEKYCKDANIMISLMCITEPFLMREDPHSHDVDKYMRFLGGNPVNIRDFGAEVELYLGEEGERYVIDTPTMVYVPKGLIHNPLNFKRINKPIMFMDITVTPKCTADPIFNQP